MKRKISVIIAAILTLALMVSLTPMPSLATEVRVTSPDGSAAETNDEDAAMESLAEENIEVADADTAGEAEPHQEIVFEPVVVVNPLYADVVSPEDIAPAEYTPADHSEESMVGSSGEIPTTEEEFAEAYRRAFDETLSQWESDFTVQYKLMIDDDITDEQFQEYFNRLTEIARANQFIHNGNPTQGDYGHFQTPGLSYGGGAHYEYDYETDKYCLIIDYNTSIRYYTTSEQEAEETAMLSTVMDSLNLESKTEYGKIKAIYDYICEHVTYDFANLNNDDYKLKYTSYAALVNGTSVCQGYSVLFYRMALEAGLDARIIAGYGGDGGSGGGGPHAWNIVKLKGLYYNIDSTWDAGCDSYSYFLKCPETFELHERDAEYETNEFHANYPMASSDYVVVPADLMTVTPTPTPTPTPKPTATNTPTPKPTATNTPTPKPTATNTPTPKPTATNTPTPKPTATNTPTPKPTATNTPTPKPTATNTPTPKPTATNTPTPKPTATNTPTPKPTATNTPTPKPTATNTPTPKPTATNTPTPKPTATNTPTPTPTATNTPTPKPTATNTPTPTPELLDLRSASIGGLSLSYGYSGKAYKLPITVKMKGETLSEGVDYTVEYGENTQPGTGYVTVTGIGKYTGTKTRTFEIVDCVSQLVSGRTYQLIPKNNSKTAVSSFGGRMVNNTKVYITDRSNSEAMKFKAVRNADGTWKFINSKCELALAVQQNSSALGAGLVLYDQTTRPAQNWKLVKKSDNSFAIINSVTGYSIAMSDASAVRGTTLSMAETASNGLQRFYLAEASAVNAAFDGTRSVRAARDRAFGLNIASASKADGANVNLYKYSNTNVKKFKIMYSGGGYYRLVNVNSGLVVSVKGNTKTNGANVIQSRWAGESGQRWKFKKNSDGSVTLTNALGTVLHLNGNKTANGTNVIAKTGAATTAQRWYLQ